MDWKQYPLRAKWTQQAGFKLHPDPMPTTLKLAFSKIPQYVRLQNSQTVTIPHARGQQLFAARARTGLTSVNPFIQNFPLELPSPTSSICISLIHQLHGYLLSFIQRENLITRRAEQFTPTLKCQFPWRPYVGGKNLCSPTGNL